MVTSYRFTARRRGPAAAVALTPTACGSSSIAKGGKPVTEVTGDHGGPGLAFHAELPTSGNWRLFLQFRTGGTLHTAALTQHVG